MSRNVCSIAKVNDGVVNIKSCEQPDKTNIGKR